MPDTRPWLHLIDEQHENPPPVSIGTVDQIDAMVDECARILGFTLDDQRTVEAAVYGASAGRYLHALIYQQKRGLTKPERSVLDHEITTCDSLARWLLVERYVRMVGDG